MGGRVQQLCDNSRRWRRDGVCVGGILPNPALHMLTEHPIEAIVTELLKEPLDVGACDSRSARQQRLKVSRQIF